MLIFLNKKSFSDVPTFENLLEVFFQTASSIVQSQRGSKERRGGREKNELHGTALNGKSVEFIREISPVQIEHDDFMIEYIYSVSFRTATADMNV